MRQNFKAEVRRAADVLVQAITHPEKDVVLGLDLDGVLDENPKFFATLSQVWPGDVFIITYRDDKVAAQADLARFGIKYTDVILVNSFAEKADVIARLAIDVYVDDRPEVLMHVPEGVSVLLMRNGGNFDYAQKKWLFSNVTGRQV
jgi:hypothetical protein